jgi:guanosine-3',5'-bis(diphosphate) 3'-pyrophosphohydrolase
VEDKTENILASVRAYADEAHGEQVRKYSDERYIVHPVRVMELVRDYIEDTSVLAAALLHDVLEDTSVTKRKLGTFLQGLMEKEQASHTLKLVEELTDIYVKSDYPKLNRRTRKNKEFERLSQISPEAQTIKYADIIDNLSDIHHDETDFALVYIRESKQLLSQMTQGNQFLYGRALQRADEALRDYWDKANVKSL